MEKVEGSIVLKLGPNEKRLGPSSSWDVMGWDSDVTPMWQGEGPRGVGGIESRLRGVNKLFLGWTVFQHESSFCFLSAALAFSLPLPFPLSHLLSSQFSTFAPLISPRLSSGVNILTAVKAIKKRWQALVNGCQECVCVFNDSIYCCIHLVCNRLCREGLPKLESDTCPVLFLHIA